MIQGSKLNNRVIIRKNDDFTDLLLLIKQKININGSVQLRAVGQAIPKAISLSEKTVAQSIAI